MPRKAKHLSKAEYRALLRKWNEWHALIEATTNDEERQRCIKARTAIETEVLKSLHYLIVKMVKRRCRRSPELYEDTLAAAQTAILDHAFRGWDEEKAPMCCFSSYACNWIRTTVDRFVDRDTPVALPYNRRRKALQLKYQGNDVPEELRDCIPPFVYGDIPRHEDLRSGDESEDQVMWDLYKVSQPQHVAKFNGNQIKRLIRQAIEEHVPDARDRYIIEGRLRPEDPSLRELADELGITPQSVSIRLNKIYDNLRKALGPETLELLCN